jgi:hypothetical protein
VFLCPAGLKAGGVRGNSETFSDGYRLIRKPGRRGRGGEKTLEVRGLRLEAGKTEAEMKNRFKVQGTRCVGKSGRAAHDLEPCHERVSITILLALANESIMEIIADLKD